MHFRLRMTLTLQPRSNLPLSNYRLSDRFCRVLYILGQTDRTDIVKTARAKRWDSGIRTKLTSSLCFMLSTTNMSGGQSQLFNKLGIGERITVALFGLRSCVSYTGSRQRVEHRKMY